MGNCLVTKLKESVQNNDLLKMGEVRLSSKATGTLDNTGFFIGGVSGIIVEVTDGGVLYDSNKEPISGNRYEYVTGTVELYFTPGSEVHIYNKYNIGTFEIKSNVILNGDQLAYSNVGYLYISNGTFKLSSFNNINTVYNISANQAGADLTGMLATDWENTYNNIVLIDFSQNSVDIDIAKLSGKTALQALRLMNSGERARGNIISLGSCLDITAITVYNTSISGELKDFAAAQVAAGRTSGSCLIVTSAYMTLDGEALPNWSEKTITFNSSLPGGYSIS